VTDDITGHFGHIQKKDADYVYIMTARAVISSNPFILSLFLSSFL